MVALGAVIPATHGFVVGLLEEVPLPPALLPQVQAQLRDVTTYLWANWPAKNLYQTLVVAALVFGAGALAPEFGRGTAVFLFSRPVTRRAVVLAKFAVGVAGLALAALAGTLALDLTARAVLGQGVPWTFYAALVPATAGASVVYGIALWFSARGDDGLRAGVWAALAAAALSVPSWVPNLQVASVYVHMTARPLFLEGRFPWLEVLGLAAVTALLVLASARALEGRDV